MLYNMNLSRYQNKLLNALNFKGRRIAVNTIQVWSDEYGKTMSKYEIIEFVTAEDYRERTGKKPRGNTCKIKIYDSYSKAKIVQTLALIYNDVVNE